MRAPIQRPQQPNGTISTLKFVPYYIWVFNNGANPDCIIQFVSGELERSVSQRWTEIFIEEFRVAPA